MMTEEFSECMTDDKGISKMSKSTIAPGLYGLDNSNRDFTDSFFWGKNQFNSSFPAALCCYMRDRGKTAVGIFGTNTGTKITTLSFDEVFGSKLPNNKLRFDFEDTFEPYREHVNDALEKIDLVVKDNETGMALAPLEIKLTTLPDDGTSTLSEENYGSEIVVRSPTTRYIALGIAHYASASAEQKTRIRNILEPVCGGLGSDWESVRAMLSCKGAIFNAMEVLLREFLHIQKPLLVQPIWKTMGKKPILAEECLDVFVWSDFALLRLIMDMCKTNRADGNKITRPQRAVLRMARFLYEFSLGGRVYQGKIYDGMTYGTLGDKEFSVPGSRTNKYMKCKRLIKPIVTKNEIKKIVLGGGQKFLSPERRFDSILFFTKELFDE